MSTKLDTLTVNEAAEALGVNHVTIRRLIQRGELKAYRVGKGRNAPIRIYPADLKKVMRPATPLAEVVHAGA